MKAAEKVTECEGEIKWEEAERNGGCYSALFVLYMSIITFNLKHVWLKYFNLIENQYSQLHQLHLQPLQGTMTRQEIKHFLLIFQIILAVMVPELTITTIIKIQPKTFQTSLPAVLVVA